MVEITEFINNFIKENKNNNPVYKYTHGYCLMFALLLQNNYPGTIIYLPEACHFVFMRSYLLYDITGNVTNKYKSYKKVKFEELSEKQLLGYTA